MKKRNLNPIKEEHTMPEKKNAAPEATESKDTIIRIPACVTETANRTMGSILPEVVTKRLPETVNKTKLKVAVPVAGVLSYLGYRLFRKVFKKSEAPKAQ